QRRRGDAVLQCLRTVGADQHGVVGGTTDEVDGASPDRRAADGAKSAHSRGAVIEVEGVDAAAVGAGQEGVGVLVQLQVADLDVGHAGAEILPVGGGVARGQEVDPPVGADVDVVGPRINDHLPGRQVGQVVADVGPVLAGIGGHEDVSATEDV